MADRQFDIIIFGATGFTGFRVVKYLIQYLSAQNDELKFAIAGRSESRLLQVRKKFGTQFQDIPIFIADVKNSYTLDDMCAQTRVVVNCVGPYRYFGQPVVEACVKKQTNYVDVTGEPQFVESMMMVYGQEAQRVGITIVHCCGFDSIPADLGVLFTASQYQAPARISAVESFLTLHTGPASFKGHYATWESAVMGFGDAKLLRKTRKQLRKIQATKVPVVGKKIKIKKFPFRNKNLKGNPWCLPFPGSDASVVRNSHIEIMRQATQEQKQGEICLPQYAAYFTVKTTFYLIILMIVGLVFQILAYFSWGRKLLKKYPKIFSLGAFSHDGPTEKQMKQTSFQTDFYGTGFAEDLSKKYVHTRVSGPEPGYAATPIFVIQSALTILREESGVVPHGVLTPGAAFSKSNLISNLQKESIRFEIISEKQS